MQCHLDGPPQRNGSKGLMISVERKWKTRNALSFGKLLVDFRRSFSPDLSMRYRPDMAFQLGQHCRPCRYPVYLYTCRQVLTRQVLRPSLHSVLNISPVLLASIISPAVGHPRSCERLYHSKSNRSQSTPLICRSSLPHPHQASNSQLTLSPATRSSILKDHVDDLNAALVKLIKGKQNVVLRSNVDAFNWILLSKQQPCHIWMPSIMRCKYPWLSMTMLGRFSSPD